MLKWQTIRKSGKVLFLKIITILLVQVFFVQTAGICALVNIDQVHPANQSDDLSPKLLLTPQLFKIFSPEHEMAINYFLPENNLQADISAITNTDKDKIKQILFAVLDRVKMYKFRYADFNFNNDLSEFKFIKDSTGQSPIVQVESGKIILNISYSSIAQCDDLLLLALGYGMLLQCIKVQHREPEISERTEEIYVLNKLITRFEAYGKIDKKRQVKIYNVLGLSGKKALPSELIKKIIGAEVYANLGIKDVFFNNTTQRLRIINSLDFSQIKYQMQKIEKEINLRNLQASQEILFFKNAKAQEIVEFLLTGKISVDKGEYVFNVNRFSDLEIIIRDVFIFLSLYRDKPQQLTYYAQKIMNAMVSFLVIIATTDNDDYRRYLMPRIDYFKQELGFASVNYLHGPIVDPNVRLRLEALLDTLLKITKEKNSTLRYNNTLQVHKIWKQLEVNDMQDVDELVSQLDTPFYSIVPILLFEALQKSEQDILVKQKIISEAFPELLFNMIKRTGKDRWNMGGYLTLFIGEVLSQTSDEELIRILTKDDFKKINKILDVWQKEFDRLSPERITARNNLSNSITIMRELKDRISKHDLGYVRKMFREYLRNYITKNVYPGEFIAFILAIGNKGVIDAGTIDLLVELLKKRKVDDRPVIRRAVAQAIRVLLKKICLSSNDAWGKGNLHLLFENNVLQKIAQEEVNSLMGKYYEISQIDSKIIQQLSWRCARLELAAALLKKDEALNDVTAQEMINDLKEHISAVEWLKMISIKKNTDILAVDKGIAFLMQNLAAKKNISLGYSNLLFRMIVKIASIYGIEKIQKYLNGFILKEEFFQYLYDHSYSDDAFFVLKDIADVDRIRLLVIKSLEKDCSNQESLIIEKWLEFMPDLVNMMLIYVFLARIEININVIKMNGIRENDKYLLGVKKRFDTAIKIFSLIKDKKLIKETRVRLDRIITDFIKVNINISEEDVAFCNISVNKKKGVRYFCSVPSKYSYLRGKHTAIIDPDRLVAIEGNLESLPMLRLVIKHALDIEQGYVMIDLSELSDMNDLKIIQEIINLTPYLDNILHKNKRIILTSKIKNAFAAVGINIQSQIMIKDLDEIVTEITGENFLKKKTTPQLNRGLKSVDAGKDVNPIPADHYARLELVVDNDGLGIHARIAALISNVGIKYQDAKIFIRKKGATEKARIDDILGLLSLGIFERETVELEFPADVEIKKIKQIARELIFVICPKAEVDLDEKIIFLDSLGDVLKITDEINFYGHRFLEKSI